MIWVMGCYGYQSWFPSISSIHFRTKKTSHLRGKPVPLRCPASHWCIRDCAGWGRCGDWSWQNLSTCFRYKKLEIGETIAREHCLFKFKKYRHTVEELYAVTLLYVLSIFLRYGAFYGCFSIGAGHQRVDCLMTRGVPHPYSEGVFFQGLSNEGNHITVQYITHPFDCTPSTSLHICYACDMCTMYTVYLRICMWYPQLFIYSVCVTGGPSHSKWYTHMRYDRLVYMTICAYWVTGPQQSCRNDQERKTDGIISLYSTHKYPLCHMPIMFF